MAESRQEYRDALKISRIENPCAEDPRVRGIFPHLSEDEIAKVLDTTHEGLHYIPAPPLRVDQTVQLIQFNTGFTDGSTVVPPYIQNSRFAGDSGEDKKLFPHIQRAVEYARQHWKADLVNADNNWKGVIKYQLYSPLELDEEGNPKYIEQVSCVLNRDLDKIINDHSTPKPRSQKIDDCIIEATTDWLVTQEFRAWIGKEGHTSGQCGSCASGFNCTCFPRGVNSSFFRDTYSMSDPIPSKLIQLLVSEGFKFRGDTQATLQREQNEYLGIK